MPVQTRNKKKEQNQNQNLQELKQKGIQKKEQYESKIQQQNEKLENIQDEFKDLETQFSLLSINEKSQKIKERYFNYKEVQQIKDSLFFEQEINESSGDPNSKIGYVYHKEMLLHRHPKRDHCERPERIKAIDYQLTRTGLKDKLFLIDFQQSKDDIIKLVHDQDYLDKFKTNEENKFTQFPISGDIYTNQFTQQAAYMGLGGCLKAFDLLMEKKITQALCNVRPPGHHAYAKTEEPTGFCFLNNAAVVSKYALKDYPEKIKRVVIFDWDVHHGDGTQRALYNNQDILFISIHQFQDGYFYPGGPQGNFNKIGEDKGKGYNINIPWNVQKKKSKKEYSIPNSSDYIYICQKLLFPIIQEFQPDLILISAGFDSARGDPLGNCDVLPKCYAYITCRLREIQPNLIVLLEGGYNLQALSYSCEAIVKGLINEPLPFESIYMQEKTWEEMEQNIEPQMELFDGFLPQLVYLLSDYWECVKRLLPEYQEQLEKLQDDDYKDKKHCNTF